MEEMNITPDLPFLKIHSPFTNERISVYLDKHSRMSLDKNGYFVKQISHLSKGVIIVASATIVNYNKIVLHTRARSTDERRHVTHTHAVRHKHCNSFIPTIYM